MDSPQSLGPHTYTQQNNFLRFRIIGHMTEEHAQGAIALYEQILSTHPFLRVLLDLKEMGLVEPKARRLYIEWGRKWQHRYAIAAIKGGTLVHTIFLLIVRGARLMFGIIPNVAHFSDEAAAQRWLSQEESAARS